MEGTYEEKVNVTRNQTKIYIDLLKEENPIVRIDEPRCSVEFNGRRFKELMYLGLIPEFVHHDDDYIFLYEYNITNCSFIEHEGIQKIVSYEIVVNALKDKSGFYDGHPLKLGDEDVNTKLFKWKPSQILSFAIAGSDEADKLLWSSRGISNKLGIENTMDNELFGGYLKKKLPFCAIPEESIIYIARNVQLVNSKEKVLKALNIIKKAKVGLEEKKQELVNLKIQVIKLQDEHARLEQQVQVYHPLYAKLLGQLEAFNKEELEQELETIKEKFEQDIKRIEMEAKSKIDILNRQYQDDFKKIQIEI